MSVRMRLSRGGRKKLPYYHIVVADSRRARDGKFIEKIGYYNPMAKADESTFFIKEDRAQDWFSKGALATDSLAKLMVKNNVGPQKIRDDFTKRNDRRIALKKDELEAKQAAEAAAKAAEEAAAKAEADAAAAAEAEETPAEEAPAEVAEADAEKANS